MGIMNLRYVYIGRYKNSDTEKLFYQKSLMKYMKLCEYDEDKEVYASEIDLNSLISFHDAIPTEEEKLGKPMIFRLYWKDRFEKIKLKEVSVGDIYRVDDVLDDKGQKSRDEGEPIKFVGHLIKQGALLINEGEFFKDMEHSIIIKRNQYPKKGELVVIEDDQLLLTPSSRTGTEKLQPFTSIVPMEEDTKLKTEVLRVYRKYMI